MSSAAAEIENALALLRRKQLDQLRAVLPNEGVLRIIERSIPVFRNRCGFVRRSWVDTGQCDSRKLRSDAAAPAREYLQIPDADQPLMEIDRKSTRLNSSHRT